MKILVTGGTGYIGSHTVAELIDKGYEVVIADNLSNSYLHVLDSISKISGITPEFIQLDFCDKKSVYDFFENQNIDAVIHFAAYKSVGDSVREPLKYYYNNISSLLNLIGAMKEYKTKHLVFSSSCSVYGNPEVLPVNEHTPFGEAASPYARTKQMCENIIEDCARAFDLQAITLRYFNPIGSHETGLLGEWPIGSPTNLVPVITQTVSGKRNSLEVFGDDYNTPDGSCIRDYIHVSDVADAHVSAIERLVSNKNTESPEVYNLGCGKGYSVLEVIHAFENTCERKVNYKIVERRAGDVEKIFSDNTKAVKILGWNTKRSLETALLSAWKWEEHLTKISNRYINK